LIALSMSFLDVKDHLRALGVNKRLRALGSRPQSWCETLYLAYGVEFGDARREEEHLETGGGDPFHVLTAPPGLTPQVLMSGPLRSAQPHRLWLRLDDNWRREDGAVASAMSGFFANLRQLRSLRLCFQQASADFQQIHSQHLHTLWYCGIWNDRILKYVLMICRVAGVLQSTISKGGWMLFLVRFP
jgi:hypothetical protein